MKGGYDDLHFKDEEIDNQGGEVDIIETSFHKGRFLEEFPTVILADG